MIYKVAAVWLGFLNYLFMAACLSWLVWYSWLALRFTPGPSAARPWIAGVLSAMAVLTGIYGMLNARVIRIRRIAVELPGLPESWRGRRAVLLSDLHLGNINRVGIQPAHGQNDGRRCSPT